MKKRQGDSDYEISVTTINGRHHARLYYKDDVIDEMACEEKADIGYICRTMMRWADKCGGDAFTNASRDRRNVDLSSPEHRGRIWYRNQLEKMKEKNEHL